MSGNFKVGDRVVCINPDGYGDDVYIDKFNTDITYTIESICDFGLFFVEDDGDLHNFEDWALEGSEKDPLKETRISFLILQMIESVPKRSKSVKK